MEERDFTCCFTGHRPQHLPWIANENDPRCLALKERLAAELQELYESGYRRFLCGMALGCDMYFAEAVLALKELYPDAELEAVIPCGSQPERWTRPQRERYNSLIDRCDRVSVLQVHYTPDCMMRRNRCLVDRSSLLLACYRGTPGGTRSTILYAMRQEIPVVTLEIE